MSRLRLIHWNAAEADRYLKLLKEAGHRVEYLPEFSPRLMGEWRTSPPDAFIIDMTRLPSHGREIAIALRQSKTTRRIPIVFCEGENEKIAKTKALLPDAVYCEFSRLKSSLRAALRSFPTTPAVPTAMMDLYATRTTAQKLGIKSGDAVCLIEAPGDMPAALGELPAAVNFVESLPAAVTLFFATDPQQLQRELSEWRTFASNTKLWVCWRKGKPVAGVSERLVRETGISLGLVDYKICSLNAVWSALIFSRKKATGAG